MTKKHFEALASALRQTMPYRYGVTRIDDESYFLTELAQWKRDVEHIASVCQSSNSNFDYKRFIAACEGK